MTDIPDIAAIKKELRLLKAFEDAQAGLRAGREYADARGVPCVGRGMSSAIPGSDPLAALLAKERRGDLELKPRAPLPRPEPEAPVRNKRLGRRVVNQRHI